MTGQAGDDEVPIPANPKKVSDWPPSPTPTRVISFKPRVRIAARLLSPRPSPSEMPQIIAKIFLSAPASSARSDPDAGKLGRNRPEKRLHTQDRCLIRACDDRGGGHALADFFRVAGAG